MLITSSTPNRQLLINRVPKAPDVTSEELQRLLGIPIHSMLPDDYVSIYEAYAEGQLLPANTNLGKHLARLAAAIVGIPEQTTKKKSSILRE